MKVAMLAARVGRRLGLAEAAPPKALLRFNGESLLKRHLDILAHFGLLDLTLVVGHQSSAIEEELGAIGARERVRTCPRHRAGSRAGGGVAQAGAGGGLRRPWPGRLAGRRARDGVTGAQAVGRRSTGLPRHS
jgi:NDP-sugar pyrophosphorylase family protein